MDATPVSDADATLSYESLAVGDYLPGAPRAGAPHRLVAFE